VTAYDLRARVTAGRLLASIAAGGKGQIATLNHIVPGAYNPATSTTPGPTTITQIGSGALFEYSAFLRSGLRNDKNMGLIVAGDKQFLMSALNSAGQPLSPIPQITDTVTLSTGVIYTITQSSPLSPAGTPIFFELNLRGGA
jgi:hypothetical protein